MNRDPEFMRKIGSKGGKATKAKYGVVHFKKIIKKRHRAEKKAKASAKG